MGNKTIITKHTSFHYASNIQYSEYLTFAMEPFVYLRRYEPAICQDCQFACVADEVPTHLRIRHSNLSIEKRNQITQKYKHLSPIIHNQAGLAHFQFPTS